jgi:hypothetical protein
MHELIHSRNGFDNQSAQREKPADVGVSSVIMVKCATMYMQRNFLLRLWKVSILCKAVRTPSVGLRLTLWAVGKVTSTTEPG